jgi:hypothetical protein
MVFAITIVNTSVALMDLITDTILIVEAKKDPYNGIENLRWVSNMASILGGVIGSLLGGFLSD